MLTEGYDDQYTKVVTTYLALMIDRQVDYNSILCVWGVAGEYVAHVFGRQALAMTWDYFELCPWSNSTGDWNSASKWFIYQCRCKHPTSEMTPKEEKNLYIREIS